MPVSSRRACPLCGGRSGDPSFPYATRWNGRDFTYVRCVSCAAIYVDPVPTPSELAVMYSRENYHDRHYAHLRPEGHYRDSAELLRRLSGGRRKLLDFGCGNGSFLLAATAAGFECVGIEYEPSAIENARRNAGVPVDDLGTVQASGQRFDIIHLGDVLEHLPDPYQTMRSLSALLAPGGLFFVEGPLQSNPSIVYFVSVALKRVRRLVGADRIATSAPTHLMLVGRQAQAAFFSERLGFRQLFFEVYEMGWPYRVEGRRPGSLGELVKHGIGSFAVVAARARLGGWPELGNRFRALLEVEPSTAPSPSPAALQTTG